MKKYLTLCWIPKIKNDRLQIANQLFFRPVTGENTLNASIDSDFAKLFFSVYSPVNVLIDLSLIAKEVFSSVLK